MRLAPRVLTLILVQLSRDVIVGKAENSFTHRHRRLLGFRNCWVLIAEIDDEVGEYRQIPELWYERHGVILSRAFYS